MVLGGDTGDREGHWAQLVAEDLGIQSEVFDESLFEATDPLADTRLVTPEPTPYQWTEQ